jgi:hypothetical protein
MTVIRGIICVERMVGRTVGILRMYKKRSIKEPDGNSQRNGNPVTSELEKDQCSWVIYIYVSIKPKVVPNWITCPNAQIFVIVCEQ